jgi:hypothetical protein
MIHPGVCGERGQSWRVAMTNHAGQSDSKVAGRRSAEQAGGHWRQQSGVESRKGWGKKGKGGGMEFAEGDGTLHLLLSLVVEEDHAVERPRLAAASP